MVAAVIYPVQVLREHLTALEAAITVCSAGADPKPVHRLRTEARRVEALLSLLALVPGLPEHRSEAAACLGAIARLRRAAGKVRDLDVHRKMLESFAEDQDSTAIQGSKAKGKGKSSGNAGTLSEFADELRDHLGRKREKAATALTKLVARRQVKTARAAEKLMAVLDPATGFALQGADVLHDAEAVLDRGGPLNAGDIAALGKKDLHNVRKAAKAARYVAESGRKDPALSKAARAFEALQDAGGQWHDALELARLSRRCFGKKHPLTAFYREECGSKLQAYREALKARVAVA